MMAVLPALIVPVIRPMSHRKYAIDPTAAVASADCGAEVPGEPDVGQPDDHAQHLLDARPAAPAATR